MAADDKGTGSETPLHVAPGATAPTERAPQTEWTASDRRGPLGSADEDDVERVVPAHEIDAVGGADSGAATLVDPAVPPHGDATAPEREIASSPAAEPEASSTPSPAVEPKRSLLPVAAGLVIGAVIGAGSAWLVYANGGPAGDGPQLAALSSKVDALEKRADAGPELARLRDAIGDVQGKVAGLEKRGADTRAPEGDAGGQRTSSGAAPDAALAARVAALQSTVDGLKNRAAAPTPPAGDAGATDKIAALQAQIAAARKQAGDAAAALDSVKGEQQQLGAKMAALNTALSGSLAKAEGAQKQASDARSGLDAVQGRQKELESKLGSPALAVVADSLVEQVRAGQPFDRQVEALAALNADPAKVALLREKAGGVASAQALLTAWKPLENAVIAAGNKAPADAGFGQRLEHGLFGLVSVRRADGTVGDDLASRVSAIEADLVHGDVAGAAAAWQALPPDAKARSDAWGGKLGASATTLATARDLQRAAIDALGGRKS